ncbi:MAG: 50S ribosomal protein L29 [Nitrospirae bacterium]|nr:50S ribosomal protein L29 [Nitrospirota bacterium]
MEVKELRDLAEAELDEKETQLVQELFNLRLQMATGRLENPMKIRDVRRDVARVKTIRRQQTLAKEAGSAQGGQA